MEILARTKKHKKIIGKRFGRLEVIAIPELQTINQSIKVTVLCDCGKVKDVFKKSLKSGNTKSCGCLRVEANGQSMKLTHKAKTQSMTKWAKELNISVSTLSRRLSRSGMALKDALTSKDLRK